MKPLEQNPYYRQAMAFLRENDLSALPVGKHVLDEGNLWVNIVETELRPVEKARLEVHDTYIDLQLPLSGPESFGVKPRSECKAPVGAMDPVKDILFYEDKVEEMITKKPGEMAVFAPDTAHAPLIGEGPIRKAIFKVRVV